MTEEADGSGPRLLRRGRPLGQGDLRYLLLHLLAERPRHGYDLIRLLDSFPQATNQPGTMSPARLRAALGLE